MLAAAVLALAWVAFRYGDILLEPNSVLLGNAEDGLKNYFTAAWHMAYSSNPAVFGAVQYPYGEHILFTDNQPLLSLLGWGLQRSGVPVAQHSVALFNLLMILSIPLTAALGQRLAYRLGVRPVWLTVLAATGLALLSPQGARIEGHYALSYSWVLPAAWLLWLNYRKTSSLRNACRLLVVVLTVSLLHLYYLPLVVLLLGALWLFSPERGPGLRWRSLPWVIVAAAGITYTLIQLWLHTTGYAAGRSPYPWGIGKFHAYPESLLLPLQFEPHGTALAQWLNVDLKKQTYEGYAYLGLPAAVFLVGMLLKLLLARWFPSATQPSGQVRQLAWAAVLVAVVACGIPFAYLPAEVLDVLGPVRQFRALGRFGWAAFWLANMGLLLWLTERSVFRNPAAKIVVTVGVPLILLVEGSLYQQNVVKEFRTPNPFQETTPPTLTGGPKAYAALLPLPGFHRGSEWIAYHHGEPTRRSARATRLLSWQTGLPYIGSNLARGQLPIAWKTTELYHPRSATADLLADLPPERPPYLLILCTAELTTLQPAERAYYRLSQPVGSWQGYELRRLSLARLRQYYKQQSGSPPPPPAQLYVSPGSAPGPTLGVPRTSDSLLLWVRLPRAFAGRFPPEVHLLKADGTRIRKYLLLENFAYRQGDWCAFVLPLPKDRAPRALLRLKLPPGPEPRDEWRFAVP